MRTMVVGGAATHVDGAEPGANIREHCLVERVASRLATERAACLYRRINCVAIAINS